MGAYLVLTGLMARDRNDGLGWVIDLALYEPLFTLMGPQVVDYNQLSIVQERNGSRLPHQHQSNQGWSLGVGFR